MRFKWFLIGLLVILIVIIYFQHQHNNKLQEYNQQESNFNSAILNNLTSYIIPAIAPPEKKFKKFIKKTGRVLMIGVTGVIIGIMI